jgi:hypothetical protein
MIDEPTTSAFLLHFSRMAGGDTMAEQNGIYLYKPSLVAAIIAASAFGISAIVHLIQMIRKRAWFYTCLTMGAYSKASNTPCAWHFVNKT